MRKYPVTFWVAVGIATAAIASFGSSLVETTNGIFVQVQWCVEGNSFCYLWHNAIIASIILGLAFIADLLFNRSKDWDKIEISPWNPVGAQYQVLGGINIQNNKEFDLEVCTAELIAYDDDREIEGGYPGIASFMKDSYFPGKLYWFVDKEFQHTTEIARGKEGYLAIVFPSSKGDVQIAGKEFQYRLQTLGMTFIHPTDKGFVDIRISARVNNVSLPPLMKSVRVEVEGKTVFIREVIDTKAKRKRVPAKKP